MYGKLIDNQIQYAPRDYETDTNIVLNFNQDEELMQEHGFKKIIDQEPEYDHDTHYVVANGYIENEDNITVTYKIYKLETGGRPPSLEERICELETNNKIQNELFDAALLIIENMNSVLESTLTDTLIDNKATNLLIDLYAIMLNTKIKTKEQVPEKYRQQVEEVINQSHSI